MWEKLKALPLFVKVIIGFFVGINAIGLVFVAIAPSPNPNPNPQPPENPGQQVVYPNGNDPQGEVNPANRRQQEASGDDKSQLIARYKAQMAQIWSQTQQCYQESLREIPMLTQPQCVQYYSQWSIQAGMLQTKIARLESGNPNITFCQANNFPRGCEGVQVASGSGSSSSSGGSGGSSDDGNYDMQAIRGHTNYMDADGETHELPTAPYYFKDRQTGEFVPSPSPEPPNNTHTYEQMNPQN
jgi:hypothetical protein